MNNSQNIITDEEYFNDTLKTIKSDWFDKLHVLADFDRTLTKAIYDGKMRPSLISVLRHEGYMSDEYATEAFRLHDHYYSIEINPDIPMETKKEEMAKWWNEHLELLVKSGLHKRDIEKVIEGWLIEFRPGLIKFIKFLESNNIPLVIISANWLGTDSIRMFFEKNSLYSDNVKIISNTLIWDNNGNAVWYDKRVIHTFNKWETALHEYPEINELVSHRTNVVLLGDSASDPDMIEWFPYKNLLKFWFLNEKVDELLENYSKLYDIIMIHDSDWEIIGDLFE